MNKDRVKAFLYSTIFSALTTFLIYKTNLSITYAKPKKEKPIKVVLIDIPEENPVVKKLEIPKQKPKPQVQEQKNLIKPIEKKIEKQIEEKPKEEKIKSPIVQDQPKPVETKNQPVQREEKKDNGPPLSKVEKENTTKEEKENNTSPPPPPKPQVVNQDIDQLSLYLSKVKSIIDKRKSYPEEAKRFGVEGKVNLRLIVSEDGSVKSVEVVSSSGSKILDREATKLIMSIGKFPQPPDNKPLTFNISIDYKLED